MFIDGFQPTPNEIYPKHKPMVRSSGVDGGFVGLESLIKLYNITVPPIAPGQSLVSVEYLNNSGFSNSDLNLSQLNNGLPQNPILKTHIIGNDNQYPDTESQLDVQMESQLSSGADLWYWGGEKWLYTWAVKFFNTTDIPYIASHSWGWAIDQQCTIAGCNGKHADDAYVTRVNIEYLKIAARGVTMVVASGDSGAPGRSDEVCAGVNRTVVGVFPGSSPYVLSVGATFVESSNNSQKWQWKWKTPLCQNNTCSTGTSEAVVNFHNVSWTSGGGFSNGTFESQPVWQRKAVKGYLSKDLPLPTYFNPKGRAYPDISVVGHNCPTWMDGNLGSVDGTSCSSPSMASLVALINHHQVTKGKPRMGLIAPILYAMYYDEPTVFNDITKGYNWCTESECCPTRSDGGSDYGYLGSAGFDPVTGLGTPNVGRILSWLDRNT